LVSNHVLKLVGDSVFPTSMVIVDIVQYILTSDLQLLAAMAAWYRFRTFSLKLSDRYASIIACFIARMAIDLFYYELSSPQKKDYVANHIHHIATILLLILILRCEVL